MRKSGHKCTFSLYETSFEHDNLLSESLYLYNKPNTKTVEAVYTWSLVVKNTLNPYLAFAV